MFLMASGSFLKNTMLGYKVRFRKEGEVARRGSGLYISLNVSKFDLSTSITSQ